MVPKYWHLTMANKIPGVTVLARGTQNHLLTMSVLVLSMAGLLLCAPARADNLDRYIGSELSRQRIAGLSIAVIKDGKVVKAQGYGLANVETGTPATADTVYKIASVSKCFLAVAVMMLVEDSKLRLDDTIDRYFPDAPATWKTITIRQ